MLRFFCALAALLGLGLAACPLAQPAGAKSADETFARAELAPFLKRRCLGCHSGAKAKADFDLSGWKDLATATAKPEQLEAVLRQLQDETMPPAEKPQPSAAERSRIVAGLERLMKTAEAAAGSSPGRVTIRRLNRAEYNNTVRDLLGIEFRPADDFPSDDVGYGFDHIGDLLTLSPLLLEKYLRAAERITAEGLTLPPRPKPEVRRILAREFKAEPNVTRFLKDNRFRALDGGHLKATFEAPEAGKYRLKLQTATEAAGLDKARLALQVDGATVKDCVLSAANGEVFKHELELPAGKRFLRLAFENPHTAPGIAPPEEQFGDDELKPRPTPRPKVRRVGVEYLEIEGPLDRPPPPPPASYRRLFGAKPDAMLPPRDAARKLIAPLAERAYRRPVTPAEIDKLLRLFDQAQKEGGTFEEGVRLMVQGLLVSPHFLFRAELRSRPLDGEAEELDSYALASRLSYFLWSSLPDEELFRLAKADRLRDPAILAAQVRRMLKDPKAVALSENFAGQWLQLRSLANFTPDAARFPGFDDELRTALRRESELFFEAMLRENRPIGEFLDADFTYLNERLAAHYGIADVKGADFRKVKLKDGQRGGLLTQASVLCVTSNPTRTSPVKRGKWILENILASPPPPPPPGVDDLKEGDEAELTGSLRQRLEQHRAKPMCASCHARMDPLGFALENYDAVGRWRTKDGAFPIDPAGSLPGGRSFRNAAELKGVLRGKLDDFRRCLCEKMLTYALGRGLEPADKVHVSRLCESLRQQDDRFADLLAETAKSAAFRTRQPLPR